MAVLLCAHNGSRFLAEQLASLRAQTRAAAMVLAHDWGSTDDTLAIVERFAALERGSVRWHVTSHADAPGACRSFLAALCDTIDRVPDFDYLLFCDQDDVWHPQKLEAFAEAIRCGDAPAELLYCDVAVIDAAGRMLAPSYLGKGGAFGRPMDTGHLSTLFVSTVSGMSMAVSRGFLLRYRQAWEMPQWVMHDWAVSIVAHLASARVQFIPRSLVNYRQHDANVIGGQGAMPARRSIAATLARARRHVAQVHRQHEACATQLPSMLARRLESPIGRWSVARTVLAGRSLGLLRTFKVALGYLLLWPRSN